jgi:hypothetical protein
MNGRDSGSGNIPLYLAVISESNEDLNLYLSVFNPPASGMMNLFLKGRDSVSGISNIPLFIWSTTNSGLFSTIPLSVYQDVNFPDQTHSMNLYLKTDEYGIASQSLDLFLNQDTTTYSGINLYSCNNWIANSGTLRLFMCAPSGTYGAVPISGSMNMFIARDFEGALYSINLFQKVNEGYSGNFPLFISGSISHNDSVNLYMKTVDRIQNSGLLLYNHGF